MSEPAPFVLGINKKHPALPWICSFATDPGVYICVRTPPNWFHRQMQRLLLGIKWEKDDA